MSAILTKRACCCNGRALACLCPSGNPPTSVTVTLAGMVPATASCRARSINNFGNPTENQHFDIYGAPNGTYTADWSSSSFNNHRSCGTSINTNTPDVPNGAREFWRAPIGYTALRSYGFFRTQGDGTNYSGRDFCDSPPPSFTNPRTSGTNVIHAYNDLAFQIVVQFPPPEQIGNPILSYRFSLMFSELERGQPGQEPFGGYEYTLFRGEHILPDLQDLCCTVLELRDIPVTPPDYAPCFFTDASQVGTCPFVSFGQNRFIGGETLLASGPSSMTLSWNSDQVENCPGGEKRTLVFDAETNSAIDEL